MAFQYTDYSGYGDESDLETRKRRAMLMAGMGAENSFTDALGQYATNRIGQAQNTMNQAGQMFTNPEEELQKRMGMAQQPVAGAVAPSQLEQPNVPQQMPTQAPEQIKPVSPDEFQAQLPQPGPGVQVAGPAQLPPQAVQAPAQVQATQPTMGQVAPSNMAAVAGQPGVTSAYTPTVERQTEPLSLDQQYTQTVIDARNEQDPNKRRNMFAQILAGKEVPEGTKTLANRLIAEDYMKQRDMAEAERKIQEATPNDLSRYMRDKSKEGSLVKAILYSRLGLNELAQKEQELLSPTLKMSSAVDDKGIQYTVERDKDGAIVRGFDTSGKSVDQNTLARLGAAVMPTQAHLLPSVHGTPVQRTNQQGQVETGLMMYDPRTQQSYVQVGNTKQAPTGWTTMSQNVQAVYGAAGAGQQGKQAATTGVQQPQLPPMAGQPQVQAQPQANAQPAQAMPQAQAQPQAGAQPVQGARPQAQALPTGGVKLTAPKQQGGGGGATVVQQPGESFASFEQRRKASEEATQADIQARKELRVAEAKPPAEARGKIEAKDVNNQAFANSTYDLIKPINDAIKQSTGSGLGAGTDKLAGMIGASTKGAQAIAKLEVLSYPILSNVPRFEGPQSDYDVQVYRQAAGDFANASKPVATRLAALDAMITILKKYDKAGKNDWTFGSGSATEGSGTTTSGNKYKRVQ